MSDDDFRTALGKVLVREMPDVLALDEAERLSGGASQETYRLRVRTSNGDRLLAMRRAPGGEPRNTDTGYPNLATEAHLMQCARAVGVPEPDVHYVLQPSDGLGEGFVMEWLEGEALGARIVRSPELEPVRPHLAYECGRALARIHAIDLTQTGLDRALEHLSAEQFVRQTWERYQAFETPQPMIDYSARWLLENLPPEAPPRLVHNDFRNGNIMVGPDGLVAVLDWETAHIGDPMRDLGWICTRSWRFGRADLPVGGFGEYADLFRGYEEESGHPVDPQHVRFWEVFGSFWWAVGCLGMAEHYRTGPDQTVERPAIGRRSSECQVDCVNLLIPGPVQIFEPNAAAVGVADMPSVEELLVSVREYLHGDVMDATSGRLNFLARVAGNSLAIVERELTLGEAQRSAERRRLQGLFAADTADTGAPASDLRWRLVRELRDGSRGLDDPQLVEYLRESVVNQVAIDQPRYPGFRTARDHSTS